MSDFYQTGEVATFHRLGEFNLEHLENNLLEISQFRGITLVLPCLYEELSRPALAGIIEELQQVRYLREIVVSLGRATEEQFYHARKYFSVLPQKVSIIWNDGPRIAELYHAIREVHLNPGPDGKGRSAWIACGYIIAEGGSRVIALHDCDITTYSRELLGRLVFPVASSRMDFEFCKGFYSRVTDRMHGRVTRLFVTPLLRALMKIVGWREILRYFDSFRYPLAGEFSMVTDLARINRIPADWGLEVGVLAEIYRNCSIKRVCQSELCDNYEHKHQDLSPDDPEKGLNKMATDIARSLFTTLATENVIYSPGFFKTLRAVYSRIAQDFLARYDGDSMINGLEYDRHLEGVAVEVFAKAIRTAGEMMLEARLGPPCIPNWNRVFAAIPDFPQRLRTAVSRDNTEDSPPPAVNRIQEYLGEKQ
jgi:glucosyl-3-phosphoglycerate synthase